MGNEERKNNIVKVARQFKIRKEWRSSDGGKTYQLARYYGILDECTAHMRDARTDSEVQNAAAKQRIIDYARGFQTRIDWIDSDGRKSYQMARHYKILRECTAHMNDQRFEKNYSDEEVVADALRYTTIKEWKKNSIWSYRLACVRGLRAKTDVNKIKCPNAYGQSYVVYRYEFPDQRVYFGITCSPVTRWPKHAREGAVFAYQVVSGQIPVHTILYTGLYQAEAQKIERSLIREHREKGWTVINKHGGGGLGNISPHAMTDAQLIEIARRFQSKIEWERQDGRTYRMATRYGILDQCCAHMTPLCRKWTLDEMKACAAKYPSRYEFMKNEIACAAYARRKGVYDQITAHMPKHIATARAAAKPVPAPKEPRFVWTPETVLADAQNYSCISDWIKGSRNAYNFAKKSVDLWAKCTQHMKRPEPLPHAVSDETKLKMSTSAKERTANPEWKAAHSAKLKGRHLTNEHRAAIAAANKGHGRPSGWTLTEAEASYLGLPGTGRYDLTNDQKKALRRFEYKASQGLDPNTPSLQERVRALSPEQQKIRRELTYSKSYHLRCGHANEVENIEAKLEAQLRGEEIPRHDPATPVASKEESTAKGSPGYVYPTGMTRAQEADFLAEHAGITGPKLKALIEARLGSEIPVTYVYRMLDRHQIKAPQTPLKNRVQNPVDTTGYS